MQKRAQTIWSKDGKRKWVRTVSYIERTRSGCGYVGEVKIKSNFYKVRQTWGAHNRDHWALVGEL